MSDLADQLDEAIARRLARQSAMYNDFDPLLAGLDQLEALRDIPYPNARTVAQGKRVFLTQAREILAPIPAHRQKQSGISFLNFKEAFSMSHFLRVSMAMLLVIVMLVFGGGGAVAYASQSSLPGEPLYGVKLAIEEARLSITSDSATVVVLSTELAARRIDEMVRLTSSEQPVPQGLVTRLDAQLALALQTAAGMAEPQPSLKAIQQMTRTQGMILAQALSMSPNDPGLMQAAQSLQIASNLADKGMTNLNQFRQQMNGRNWLPTIEIPGTTPSMMPAMMPTVMPSSMPAAMPTSMPAMMPTVMPSSMPAAMPTSMPTMMPTSMPAAMPTSMPTMMPTSKPAAMPTSMPTMMPTSMPAAMPTSMPTMMPTSKPAVMPTSMPATIMPGGGMGGGGMGGGKP